jgi:hypothetical protein
MYIVWRQRPVKGNAATSFLQVDPDWLGNTTCWMPLTCEHRGPDRVAHTPLVVESSRSPETGGKPRQKVLERLPTIRTCCIADGFARAAWRHRVNQIIDNWSVFMCDDPTFIHFSRDAPDILRKLREVVPGPTKKGERDFAAYRQECEAKWEAKDRAQRDANNAYWAAEQERRREQQRQQEKAAQDRLRDEIDAMFARAGIDPCFAALGLKIGAKLNEVKSRYRDLAKQHHPDRCGDPQEFVKVQAAYEHTAPSWSVGQPAEAGHYTPPSQP